MIATIVTTPSVTPTRPPSGSSSSTAAAVSVVLILLILAIATTSGVAAVLLYLYYRQRNKQATYTPRRRTRSIKCKFPENVNLRELEIVVVTEENDTTPAIDRYPSIAMKHIPTTVPLSQQQTVRDYDYTKRRRSQKCIFPEWVNLRDLEIVMIRDGEEAGEQDREEVAEEEDVENKDVEHVKEEKRLKNREIHNLNIAKEKQQDKLKDSETDESKEECNIAVTQCTGIQLDKSATETTQLFTDEEFDQLLSIQTPTDERSQ